MTDLNPDAVRRDMFLSDISDRSEAIAPSIIVRVFVRTAGNMGEVAVIYRGLRGMELSQPREGSIFDREVDPDVNLPAASKALIAAGWTALETGKHGSLHLDVESLNAGHIDGIKLDASTTIAGASGQTAAGLYRSADNSGRFVVVAPAADGATRVRHFGRTSEGAYVAEGRIRHLDGQSDVVESPDWFLVGYVNDAAVVADQLINVHKLEPPTLIR